MLQPMTVMKTKKNSPTTKRNTNYLVLGDLNAKMSRLEQTIYTMKETWGSLVVEK